MTMKVRLEEIDTNNVLESFIKNTLNYRRAKSDIVVDIGQSVGSQGDTDVQ